MKTKFSILFYLIAFAACKNSDNSSSRDSTLTKKDLFTDYNSKTDTIISKEKFQKLMIADTLIPEVKLHNLKVAVEKSNLSNQDNISIQSILNNFSVYNNNLQKPSAFSNEILEKNSEKIKQITKNKNFSEIFAAAAGVEKDYALQRIYNFRKTANSVKRALSTSGAQTDYIGSVTFDVGNSTMSDLKDLLTYNIITGIRIYFAKETNDVSKNDYELIIVGTENGMDKFFPSTGVRLSIQNYGQPCRPSCPTSGTRLDLLGKEADDMP